MQDATDTSPAGHEEYLDARRDATDHLGLPSARADSSTANPSANLDSNVPLPILPSILAMEQAPPDLTMLPITDALQFAQAVINLLTALMQGMDHYLLPFFRVLMVVADCYLKALATIRQSLELLPPDMAFSIIAFFTLLLLVRLIRFACHVWWFAFKCAIEFLLWPFIFLSLAIACQYIAREWASISMSIGQLPAVWKFLGREASGIYFCFLQFIKREWERIWTWTPEFTQGTWVWKFGWASR
uniref:WGS project CBMI000000000 data, contig CS3069_c004511 n=1 Tax=Fusarium clavum TaxID=2594811 RepID=A0A090N631_9HYPO|nr:unnamed protein product [Fusarium clavum]